MKKRLAILSSYNEACGNASYTHVLAQEFRKHCDVDIIPLNLFLLQSKFPPVVRSAKKHVDEICAKLKTYDWVNIQFEMGLYGLVPDDAISRVLRMIDASRNVIITMHRIDYGRRSILGSALRAGARLSPKAFLADYYSNRRFAAYKRFIAGINERNRRKNVAIMVHTKRELRLLNYLFGVKNARDFPITFLTTEKRRHYLASDKQAFRKRYRMDNGQKCIGIFGFISSYKGHDTALRALRHLPPEYHLLVFGSQHPQSIENDINIDPFIDSLLYQITGERRGRRRIRFINDDRDKFELHPASRNEAPLKDRVQFVGELNDDEFITALRCCDAVVLPYHEVGQSMSGVAALTLETRAHAFFTNNHSFLELKKYFGDCYHSFDIGNDLELAQKILTAQPGKFDDKLDECFERYNISENIRIHMEMFAQGAAKK